MSGLSSKARTALALGLPNLARVAAYKFGVRSGLNPVRRLSASAPPAPFFRAPQVRSDLLPSDNWREQALYFGWWSRALDGAPPDWHVNPFNGECISEPQREWWQIPDFDARVGDVKTVWEASRFDWVLAFMQRAVGGDSESADQLNDWLEDWLAHNPPYCGPNWKGGQ